MEVADSSVHLKLVKNLQLNYQVELVGSLRAVTAWCTSNNYGVSNSDAYADAFENL